MKIIFFGTPDFAVSSLDKLNKSAHEVLAVVTAPDKERGRGRKVSYTAVKQYAIDNNLPVLQPEKMKDESFVEELKKYNADLFAIVAFRILPVTVFSLPRFGSINLHGSLLPRYRGAAPIQWALINGDEETGVTTFFLKEKVDTGNMLLQEKIEIKVDDNFEILHDRMKETGANVLLRTIDLIEDGKIEPKEQDSLLATPAPKITKDICGINWNEPAVKIHNLIRGVSPFPGAFFEKGGKIYKIYKSEVVEEPKLKPGEIEETKKDIYIGCGNNTLHVLEIQPEGRKRMTADEFLRGYSLHK